MAASVDKINTRMNNIFIVKKMNTVPAFMAIVFTHV